MNGVINIFKPPGLTSHDVVSHVRRKLSIKRVGHTGTLDPMATGVLPICVGQGTKAVEYLMADEKRYRFELTLGFETDTLDAWGTITKTDEHLKLPTKEELLTVLNQFMGPQSQLPPQYSALKVDGRRAYDLARENIHVELKPRPITIIDLSLITYDENRALVDVTCSKGTYVRSLVRDIATAIGTYGTMTFLERMASGHLNYLNAVPLEIFMLSETPLDYIMSIEAATPLERISIALSETATGKILNGIPFNFAPYDTSGDEAPKLILINQKLVGIAEYSNGNLALNKRFSEAL